MSAHSASTMLRVDVESSWTEMIYDADADWSYLEQEGFEDRLAAFQREEFTYVGVRVCAQLIFRTGQGGWIHGPIITTPGLWSIEDDSGEDYFKSVAEDEGSTLVDMLMALNVQPATAERVAVGAVRNVRYRQ